MKYALILFCLASGSLQALDYAGKWGLDLYGGANSQAMADANKTLATVDTGIHNGYEAGGALFYGLASNWRLDLGVGEIFNHASFHGGQIALPALSIPLRCEYILPRFASNFDVGLGAGLEYDILDGETSVDSTVYPNGFSAGWLPGGGGPGGGSSPSGGTYLVHSCEGTTLGGQASLHGRYFFSDHWSVLLEAGYRYSVVSHVIGSSGGVSEVEKEVVDYSGLLTRLSLGYIF
jgi:hypothetical protein